MRQNTIAAYCGVILIWRSLGRSAASQFFQAKIKRA
jgi:hypothetical protein